ncbi:MAG: hypothetical protein OK422_00330 [Thaumarchaeota archaeon]|nr:hypothetical protein [Nitrososphaerota archaeon]
MSDIEKMRLRIWRARSNRSRGAGVSLVILSSVLFVVSYVTNDFVLEIASIASFSVGAVLLAYEVEPRVRLYPSSMSLLGLMKISAELLQKAGFGGAVTYEPLEDGIYMSFEKRTADGTSAKITPIGQGLFETYERELGPMSGKGEDFVTLWLPRTIVDGLGLAERMRMVRVGPDVETTITKPFVRALCVNEFMTKNVCPTMGCPLVASFAQALASSTGEPVSHLGCSYDPHTQTATSKHSVGI